MSAASNNHAASRPAAMAPPPAAAAEPRPYWIPTGVTLDDWPAELRAAVAAIIDPAYKELVLRAPPGLQQSTGLTVVFLLWLEVLEQVELGRQAGGGSPDVGQGNEAREARALQIAQLLRLVNAKLKASELFHRLDQLKFQWRPTPFPQSPDDPLTSPASPHAGP